MDSEELLAQLADIHLPEPVSFWPPAPGWWVLAVLLIVLTIWIARRFLHAGHQRRIKAQALAEFEACYTRYSSATDSDISSLKLRYVNEANSVLKRVALVHSPDQAVAGLGGSEWVDFIRENGDSSLLDTDIADALSQGRFQTSLDVDVDAVNEFGKLWINSLYDTARITKAADSEPPTIEIKETAN